MSWISYGKLIWFPEDTTKQKEIKVSELSKNILFCLGLLMLLIYGGSGTHCKVSILFLFLQVPAEVNKTAKCRVAGL